MNESTKALMDATDWPKYTEDATADALILHSARVSMAIRAKADVLMGEAFDLPKDDPQWRPAMRAYMDAATAMIAESSVAILLHKVQRHSREQADALARILWELTEDGGVLPELMYDYLTERGIDADAVWAAAEEDAR